MAVVGAGPVGLALALHARALLGLPLLGAVLGYGALLARLQQDWSTATLAEPHRLQSRFGTPVAALKPLPDGVEVDAGIAEPFDLAVVAEGGGLSAPIQVCTAVGPVAVPVQVEAV